MASATGYPNPNTTGYGAPASPAAAAPAPSYDAPRRSAPGETPLIEGREYGAPIEPDPAFSGPVPQSQRKYSDVLFALLFGAMFLAMVVLSIAAYSEGDPDILKAKLHAGTSTFSHWFDKSLAQAMEDRTVYLGVTVLALVLAVVWIESLKRFTKIFIYLTLLLGISAVFALALFLFIYGDSKGHHSVRNFAIVLLVIGFILIGVVFLFRKKIALTALVFKETCKGLQASPSLLIAEAILLLVYVAFVVYWLSILFYLYSVPHGSAYRGCVAFMVFAGFWVTAFISACLQTTIAGTISGWYFSRGDTLLNTERTNALKSLRVCFTTSLGTMAFGSLIVAIFAFISWCLRRAQKANASGNAVSRFIICTVLMCFGSCQRFVEFVNKWAYCYVALYGHAFCKAGKDVFNLLGRNGMNVVAIESVGGFVLFMGKIFGCAICTLITLAILKAKDHPLSWVTVFIIIIISFTIFHLFALQVDYGSDAIFVCFSEELERCRASPGDIKLDHELQTRFQELKDMAGT